MLADTKKEISRVAERNYNIQEFYSPVCRFCCVGSQKQEMRTVTLLQNKMEDLDLVMRTGASARRLVSAKI